MESKQEKTNTIGVKDVAAKIGTEPKQLRAFMRGMELGVGRGTRYAWPSLSDPQVKKIVAAWNKAHAEQKEA